MTAGLRRWGISIVLVGLATVLGAVVWAYVSAFDRASAPERLALGKQLYDDHCAACHGVNLEGEPNWRRRRADGTLPAPPHDQTGHTWHHPDEQLFAITKQGTSAFAPAGYKTNMLGFGDSLSDDEIRAVLDYIKSRWPEEVRARQAEITRRAKAGN